MTYRRRRWRNRRLQGGRTRPLCADELDQPMNAYLGQRVPCFRRVSREAAQAEANDVVMGLMATGLLPLLCEPPDVVGLAELTESSVEQLSHLSSHVGPLAQRLAELLVAAREEAGWTVQALFSQLLVPALAHMRAPKTRAFGVMTATLKLLWRPADWPDPEEERARGLKAFVLEHLFSGPDLVAGAWLLAHLRLDRFVDFAELFQGLFDNKQALRLYCTSAEENLQHRVVGSLVDMAAAAEKRERRELLACAADLIQRCHLDRSLYPAVARQKAINWLCYFDPELLALCVEQLAGAGDLAGAAALYGRHGQQAGEPPSLGACGRPLESFLRPGTLEQVRAACDGRGPQAPADEFAPRTEGALRLTVPEAEIVWADTAEAVSSVAAALRGAPLVGIDLEWSSIGDWLDPHLELLQLAVPGRAFLVDLSAEAAAGAIGALLELVLGGEQLLTLCFSFMHDLKELNRSRWAGACQQRRSLCDLQLLRNGRKKGDREGLSSLVKHTLGQPLCKAEQRSCWHRRPLRRAQRHYAALDAHVLLQVGAALAGVPLEQPELVAERLRAMAELQ